MSVEVYHVTPVHRLQVRFFINGSFLFADIKISTPSNFPLERERGKTSEGWSAERQAKETNDKNW